MQTWFARVVVACTLLFVGAANAQSNFKDSCVEGGPNGYMTCRLKPDGFTDWGYGSGYGVAPPDSGSSYATEDKAVQETLNYLIYTNPNYGNMCQFSYSVGGVEVIDRDQFIQSKEPLFQYAPLTITYGWKSGTTCRDVSSSIVKVYASRAITCNHPWSGTAGYWALDKQTYMCVNPVAKTPPPCETCPQIALKGNPILVTTREKIESVVDLVNAGPMPLEFRRLYRSHRARDKKLWFGTYFKKSASQDSLGDGWLHNHDIYLASAKSSDGTAIHSSSATRSGQESGFDLGSGFALVRVHMGDGTFNYFHRQNGDSAFIGRNKLHTLVKDGNRWVFDDTENERRYVFGEKGLLVEQIYRNGWRLSYGYDSGNRPASVTNNFGQSLGFVYSGVGKLVSVTSNDQRSVSFTYTDAGALKTVQQADGTTSEYVYTVSTPTVGSLLAGRIDEHGQRHSTFKYDEEGFAFSTEKAGGVDKYSVPYVDGFVDPLGTSRSHSFRVYGNELVYTGSSLASASPSDPPIKSRTIREDGLPAQKYDQEYNETTYEWDAPRRLPISITEAPGKPEVRATNFIWHPQWRSPSTVSVPGRGIVNYTYDTFGNVLTQTEVGATASNTWAWTYHVSGLVATEKAPNGAVTIYQYDGAGNLTSATNALGHVDAYTYDSTGRVLTHTAPNGLVTAYTYDPRGNVLTLNRGGLVTTFTYRVSGEVATVILPHGHRITYNYDGAHRLNGWTDNRGASATYVLDAMGNRTVEEVRAGNGQLAWRLARTMSYINRVETTTLGDSAEPLTYWQDGNGDMTRQSQTMGGVPHTEFYGRDPVRRVKSITNAANATASLTYSGADAITQAKDFNGIATDYTRDFQGNATSESSLDSGNQTAQYDALGLPSSITNALGQATTITRDLLGRPTSIVHTGGTTTLRYDQTPASKGYLSEIEDSSGLTTYQRDAHGRVVSQTQKLINNDTRTLAYSYNATTGLLASTTYPGGQALQNVYDATGQLTGLTWAGQPIVSSIAWTPLGQPTGWNWNLAGSAAAIPAARSYDTAGRLKSTEFSNYVYDEGGRITALTQMLRYPVESDPQGSSTLQAEFGWTVKYDRAGRIIGFNRHAYPGMPVDTTTYTYDANGNRTTSTQERAGTTTNRTYAVTANRQTAFSQTKSGPGGTANTLVDFQYNVAGDLLTDGLRTFQYDSQERLEKVTTGTGADAPSTQYAHNALGQRVFKTEPLFAAGSGGGSNSTTSGKNLNHLLADPEDQEAEQANKDKGIIQTAYEFFTRLWSPGSSDAQKLGFAYVYGQDGTLLGEYGMGGSNSSGTTQYIYLPTANGPMPIAAIVNGVAYAVHSDHLNTPRKLTQPDGQVAWQWAYSAFGDEQPTLGSKRFTNETTNPTTGSTPIPEVTFNLRYPGQYYDKESNLHYNYFRSYSAERGRYTQADPIGLDGGFNRFGYVDGNPLRFVDPKGLEWLIDPARRPPSIVGSNTIYCKDETPSVHLITKNACEPIVEGVRRHEKRHIADALSKKPNICSGNIGDVIIINDNAEERLLAEENAQIEQINYLKEALKTCAEGCRIPINTNINTQEYILNQRIRTGNYP